MAVLPNTLYPPLPGRAREQREASPTAPREGTAALSSPICEDASQPFLSVIVPTKNESANIKVLLQRIEAAAASCISEVIFVDDSTDDTPAVIRELADAFPFAVRLVARPPERRNGLGRAVVEGIRAATAEWICVMDSDLQHPPEAIPQLVAKARSANSTLVVASRMAAGGSTAGLSPARRLISYTLAATTRVLFSQRLRQVTDPLTGFFLVQRSALNPDLLNPEGFKILLEILVRTPHLQISEAPFVFGERHGGASKANGQEMVRLFRQTLKLAYLSQRQLLMFMVVGLTGLLVNTLLLVLFTERLGLHYLWSALLATQGSTLWNFAWTESWVFRDRRQNRGVGIRLLGFFVINNIMLAFRGPMLALFVGGLGIYYVAGNILTIAIMTLVRYAVADHVIWRTKSGDATKTYYYNIHDIIRVRSMQKLPELGYFRTEGPLDDIDIDVVIDGDLEAHRTPNSINYTEALGWLGFSIVINQHETHTKVVAAPLVGRSPHVLYTNVVESLLRWTFTRKGYALMHGASLAFGDQALFITALTDTGKTTTILHTMRNNPQTSRFLSDDMSILSPDGMIRSFPKPLTISKHTLQAIGGAPLSRFEYAALQVQSRVHSKSGRRFAMLISLLRLPAATINTVVQMIIPPPKYMVDRILPQARYAESAQLSHIVLIERGKDFQEPLPEAEKFATLITNAEDAYGFPPYPQLASRLSSWQAQDLHEAEQAIVTSAVTGMPATRMGSSTFDWYRRLPVLLSGAGADGDEAPPHWVMPDAANSYSAAAD
ncbi:glycosyltransferase family 2 protein [Caldilinea sp.]|uniref:glycosyltransferase family 2 protein n=1 Tax=Caldilinea sp. TaxID=2293560 RepID=UPI002C1B1BFA|nr:glycosyltransferase family 2 protein [Anaerolineales bacterium]HQY89968.1 glycosyltransferase family 2 protein [Caldilinea sp.]